MNYKSTRGSKLSITSAQAITTGIAPDGGLFVPEALPKLSLQQIEELAKLSYADRAAFVFSQFLTDFTEAEIRHCVDGAYNTQNFASENIAELARLDDSAYMLELWHGPTCAFKDMALQILPYLMTVSAKKTGDDKQICILVATSGDTGKAALEGFKDVEGTSIAVFYPRDGVSAVQKRQMTTQEGSNVAVCAIEGNFDDAQTGVKSIFADKELADRLARSGKMLSSANSINWGRLAPQIIYYVSSYAELVKQGELTMGQPLNVVVPTGNFGNILAAYYAKQMGVPLGKLICASNANNILTDFIGTGVYDRNRAFHTTISPSMDILVSSNLERLLFHLCGEDDAQIRTWFDALAKDGRYEVTQAVRERITEHFHAGFCDDTDTKATIARVFEQYGYLCDTHTAVAIKVYEDYRAQTGDTTKTIIASTASPYKFAPSVLEAITGTNQSDADEFALLEELSQRSGVAAPQALSGLKQKNVRFDKIIDRTAMSDYVEDVLSHL